ncbi:MAG: glycosyltransferase family 4 protein [Cyanobacteria bacterium P01_F01_bin.143]
MKILQVCALATTAKALLLPQIDYFLERNIEVEIACSPGAIADELRQSGYMVHPVQIDRKITPLGNLNSILNLTKLMRSQKYDLVHVHTPIAAVLGRVAAKLAGIKRIVYTSHGLPFHDQSSPKEYFLYSKVEKFAGKLTDLIISQNHEDIKTCARIGIAPEERLGYLGNGVDIDRFSRHRLDETKQQQLRQSLNIAEDTELLVGIVGRLTRKKGAEYLIEAAAKLIPKFPKLQILIVGGELKTDPEPYYFQLLEKIEQLGIRDRVVFTGDRSDIPEILGLLDIFCLPTFTHEGLPRSIVEAMAMALPVVTTDIRGCREVVLQARTGFIVPPQDRELLAIALSKLLGNRELRKQFGTAGRKRIEAEYDENIVFERLSKFYQQLGLGIE